MRILVITVSPSEAAFRLRLQILRPLLGPMGFNFEYFERPGDFSKRKKLIGTAKHYDAVIVQRKLLDPSHAAILAKSGRPVFFDLDDAVMVQRRKISRWSQWLKDRRFAATAKVATHVIAGNENMAAKFRELGRPVTVLPTVVDPDHYQVKQHAETSSPALVWIGSASTLPYLRQWMPAIEAAAARVPGLRLITIANETVASGIVKVEHHPWSEATEAAALAAGDIGVAPTPVDQWTTGKSGFKIVQYMATGLPTIASPVGANVDILKGESAGLLPGTMAEFTEAIVKLATNTSLRTTMGTAARKLVLDQYTTNRAAEVWHRLLSSSKTATVRA